MNTGEALTMDALGDEQDEQYDPREENSANRYWADKPAGELAAIVLEKERQFFDTLDSMGIISMWRQAYAQHFGRDPGAMGVMETQQVGFEGDGGSHVRFRINETRSFTKQIVGMAVSQRPAFQAVATNTDYSGRAQLESVDAAVNYVYQHVYGEKKERRVVEKGIVFGSAATWIQWDPDGGEYVDVPLTLPNGESSPMTEKVRSGSVVLKGLGPWDVIGDVFVEDDDEHCWRSIRDKQSKWAAADAFPDHREFILGITNTSERWTLEEILGVDAMSAAQTDQIVVKHFYHERTPSMPDGRYCVIIGDRVVYDAPMPYDTIPVVVFAPAVHFGTMVGYADTWDLLPIQQIEDQIASDSATNVSAVGRNSIFIREGTDYDLSAVANGVSVFTAPGATEAPQVLQLASIPDAAKWMIDYCERKRQSVSALNGTVRGNADANVKSGTHAALFHAIAQEANSPNQLAVDEHREAVANKILRVIKRYAKAPFMMQVAGADERPYLSEFSVDRLAGIDRVVLKTANPLSRSQAGRMELFTAIKDIPGAITSPTQVLSILHDGLWKPVTRGPRAALLRIQWENEQMLQGKSVGVSSTDPPELDLPEHIAILDAPEVRNDENLYAIVMEHIMKHVETWRTQTDPHLAILTKRMPPPPPPGMGMSGEPANDNGDSGPAANDNGTAPKERALGVSLPKPAESPVQTPSAGSVQRGM